MSDKYEVGYGKPPKQTQFQKGSSGNPKGRPTGTKNFRTDLREELGEQIVIREGDRTLKVSKQRALIKSLTAKAIKGDVRAIMALMSTALQLLDQECLADELDGKNLASEDREVLAVLQKRLIADQGQNSQTDTENKEENPNE